MPNYHFITHFDLDGYVSATLYAEIHNIKNRFYHYANNNKISQRIERVIAAKEHDSSDILIITDLSPKESDCDVIDANFSDWIVFDHHETSKINEKYKNHFHKGADAELCATGLVVKNAKKIGLPISPYIKYLSQCVNAFDTWEWQIDPNFDKHEYKDVEALDAMFWNVDFSARRTWINELCTEKENWAMGDNLLSDNAMIKANMIINHKNKYLKKVAQESKVVEYAIHDKKYSIAVVRSDEFISEVGNVILDAHPTVDFSITLHGKNKASLRSHENFDVGHFAETYLNGGGHNQSAGGLLDEESVLFEKINNVLE